MHTSLTKMKMILNDYLLENSRKHQIDDDDGDDDDDDDDEFY